jgi:vacuolar-type H+-ATPase subunit H
MNERTGFIGESIDRVQNAYQSAEGEIQKFQDDLQERRQNLEKRAQKELKKLAKEIRKNSVVQRAEEIQKDVSEQIQTGLGTVLGNLRIASQSDVQKIDKKLNKLNRKLNALDKALSSAGKATPSHPATAVAE